MKYIPLTQGKLAIVDDEDFEWLSQWKWHFNRKKYAARTINHSGKLYMHQVILNTPKGMLSDHRNGNGLDNRRKNLRACNVQQNKANSRLPKNNTSGFKGVYWEKN